MDTNGCKKVCPAAQAAAGLPVPQGDTDPVMISVYTDAQAVADGVLIPFTGPRVRSGKRINRITRAVFDAMTREVIHNGQPAIDITMLVATLLRVVLTAREDRGWYIAKIIADDDRNTLWLVPNEVGGYTALFPEDY